MQRINQALDQILINLPQLEQETPRQFKQMIFEYLFESKEPKRAPEISNALGINYNSVRRILSELHQKGFISKHNRIERMISALDESGNVSNPCMKGKYTIAYTVTLADMNRYRTKIRA